jgi:restriction system protein
VPANNGRSGLIEYRLAWARSYLKGMALLENSQRGVWSTTELGRTITQDGVPAVYAAYTAQLRETQRLKKPARAQDDPNDLHDPLGTVDVEGSSKWKEALLSTLQNDVTPDQFERLARRLLREAGFVSATVTGKSATVGSTGSGSTG